MKNVVLAILTLCLFASQGYAASNDHDGKLQERCIRKSQERFEKEFNPLNRAYQPYYNQKMDKCFMLVRSLDKTWVQSLYDVNEQGSYGIIKKVGDVRVKKVSCHLFKVKKGCESEADWHSFVKSYMEE